MAATLAKIIIILIAGLAIANQTKTLAPTSDYGGFASVGGAATSTQTALLSHKNGVLTAEVAATPSAQALGLSGRTQMPDDRGMLFVFPTDNQPSFWMKDMHFDLDLIWLKANGEIANITPNVKPDTFPATFSPQTPIRYVLEVNAGYAQKNQLTPGDFIHFSF